MVMSVCTAEPSQESNPEPSVVTFVEMGSYPLHHYRDSGAVVICTSQHTGGD